MGNKKVKKGKSKSYVVNNYKGLQSQYNYLMEYLIGYNEDSVRFVVHIIRSQIFKMWKEEGEEVFVAIPYETVKSEIGKAELRKLEEADIIQVKLDEEGRTYSYKEHRCREYRVNLAILERFIELGDIEARDYSKAPKVNLITGKVSTKIDKTIYKDNRNNPYPDLIKDSMKLLIECTIEIAPIEAHIKELKEQMEYLAWTTKEGVKSKEYLKVRGRYYNDLTCRNICLNQRAKEIIPGFYTFIPAYRPSSTGRIHFQLQNASRIMKEKAFKNIKNLNNYDLRSSQAIGLIQQFKLAGLDTTWLDDYKNNKEAKKEIAEYIGVSVDTWKKCLCALLMGGYVPCKSNCNSNAKIMEYLLKDCDNDYEKFSIIFPKFYETIKPLKLEIDKWHNWLLDVYCPKLGTYPGGKLHLKNPTGMTLNIDELPSGKNLWLRKAKVAAFVLQGQEAAFIHHLTVLSLEYDYKVLQNEHDGLIVSGIIPQEAVDKACSRSGMTSASLELKSFL